MKERSGMPYDVVAYEADDLAMQLSEAEEGLFHRMLRRSWMNGSIPADVNALASICRTHPARLKKAWIKISGLWVSHPDLGGRLINLKQERERVWVESKSERAKQSADERWKQQKLKDNTYANALPTQSERNASPSPPLPVPSQPNKEEEKKGKEPMAISSPVVPKYSDMFKGFWDLSTKRGSKVEAYREWQRLNPDVSLLEDILAAMHDWMQSAQWQDESKQPHLCRWLKRRGWEERVPRPPVIERKETRDEFIARTNRETAEIVNRGLSDPTFNGDWTEYQSRPSGLIRPSLSGPPDEPS